MKQLGLINSVKFLNQPNNLVNQKVKNMDPLVTAINIGLLYFVVPTYSKYVGVNCIQPGPDYIFDGCISYYQYVECNIITDNLCLDENPCYCLIKEDYNGPTQFPCEIFMCTWRQKDKKNSTSTERTERGHP